MSQQETLTDVSERPRLQAGLYCHYLDPSGDPVNGYQPCIVIANEPGYYRLDYKWYSDFETCERLTREQNERIGLTPEMVSAIINSSMFYPKCHYTAPERKEDSGGQKN